MSPNRHQLSSSAYVLMQFVLKVDEGCVGSWSKLDVAKNSTGD